MTENHLPAPEPTSLSGVIAAYLQAVDQGEQPDRSALLSQHPHLAEELQKFFASEDNMNQLAQPLRAAEDASHGGSFFAFMHTPDGQAASAFQFSGCSNGSTHVRLEGENSPMDSFVAR